MSSIPKPNLRGHVASGSATSLFIAGFISVSCALAYKYFVALPRQKRYAEFYKTYDPHKSFKRMHDAGLIRTFQDQDI